MKTIKCVSAGFGGQGVLTVGQLIAILAMDKDLAVSWMPSYGPEMRGGTANCHVVIDEKEVSSPLIAEGITHLLAMNQPALDKFLPRCAEDAVIVSNASLVKHVPSDFKGTLIPIDFNQIAQDLNELKVANMAAFGALLKTMPIFSSDEGIKAIIKKLGKKNESLTELNIKAFEIGYALRA
jgi:2-oxoglutarate ferredoxin oxidoreductase subunit gamma